MKITSNSGLSIVFKTGALAAACALLSLATPSVAKAGTLGITFTETINGGGPGVDTLTASLAGAIISGSSDNWTIEVGTHLGITLSSNDLPQQWHESLGESGVNVLEILNPSTLELFSEDVEPPSTPDNFCGTGSPLPQGATCFIGTDDVSNNYFATVVEQAVPEPATFALFGGGLLGLIALRKRRTRSN